MATAIQQEIELEFYQFENYPDRASVRDKATGDSLFVCIGDKEKERGEIITEMINDYPLLAQAVIKLNSEQLDNMQYYMEYCQRKGYVTPQDWLTNYKHF